MEKILVVNNDMDTMSLLKELLEKKSYLVKYTSSGEDSIRIAKKFEPALLLIDVLQKEYIPRLKAHPDTARIPVILMTGYSGNNEQMNEAEADDIIEKPFFIGQLQKKIKLALLKKNSPRKNIH